MKILEQERYAFLEQILEQERNAWLNSPFNDGFSFCSGFNMGYRTLLVTNCEIEAFDLG